jgi:hypothetical protein
VTVSVIGNPGLQRKQLIEDPLAFTTPMFERDVCEARDILFDLVS